MNEWKRNARRTREEKRGIDAEGGGTYAYRTTTVKRTFFSFSLHKIFSTKKKKKRKNAKQQQQQHLISFLTSSFASSNLSGLHQNQTSKICQNRNLSKIRKQLFTNQFAFNIETQLLVYCIHLKFDFKLMFKVKQLVGGIVLQLQPSTNSLQCFSVNGQGLLFLLISKVLFAYQTAEYILK